MANSRVFDAVQDKQWPTFLTAIEIFLGVALVVVFISTYRIYVRNILQIRWREQLTDYFLGDWIGPARLRASRAASQGHRQPGSAHLGGHPELRRQRARPVALAALGGRHADLVRRHALDALGRLAAAHRRPRVLDPRPDDVGGDRLRAHRRCSSPTASAARWSSINFDRLRFEADFRYGLVRFRDHVEAVALARGEAVEQRGALARFHNVITTGGELITAQRNLTLLTTGIGQANGIVPLLVAAPAFFAGRMTLGSVTADRHRLRPGVGRARRGSSTPTRRSPPGAPASSVSRRSPRCSTRPAPSSSAPDGIRVETAARRGLALDARRPDAARRHACSRRDLDAARRGAASASRCSARRASSRRRCFAPSPASGPSAAAASRCPRSAHRSSSPQPAVSADRHPARGGRPIPPPAGTLPRRRDRATRCALSASTQLAGRLDESEPWDQQLSADEQQRLDLRARAPARSPTGSSSTTPPPASTRRRRSASTRSCRAAARRAVLSITNRPTVAGYHQRRWTFAASGDGAVLQSS